MLDSDYKYHFSEKNTCVKLEFGSEEWISSMHIQVEGGPKKEALNIINCETDHARVRQAVLDRMTIAYCPADAASLLSIYLHSVSFNYKKPSEAPDIFYKTIEDITRINRADFFSNNLYQGIEAREFMTFPNMRSHPLH